MWITSHFPILSMSVFSGWKDTDTKNQVAQSNRGLGNREVRTKPKCHNWKKGQLAVPWPRKIRKEKTSAKAIAKNILQLCAEGFFFPLTFCRVSRTQSVKHKVPWRVHGKFGRYYYLNIILLLEQTLFWNMTIPSDLCSLVLHYGEHFQDNRMSVF